MGADPGVLDDPAGFPPGIPDEDLLAQLRAQRQAKAGGMPPRGRHRSADRDAHLLPAERRRLELARAELFDEGLPPGARPLGNLFANMEAQLVAVPIEAPEVWAAAVDAITHRAKRSSTKQAVGRQAWAPPAQEEVRTEEAARVRDARREDDRPADGIDYTSRLQ